MSKRDEKISAYLDGELHQDELMSFSLSGEQEDSEKSVSYRLIGDVLRNETSEASFVDVSAAIRESLKGEGIADQCEISQSTSQKASSIDTPQTSWLGQWLKPLLGPAVAASVAVVVVVSVMQTEQSTNSQLAETAEPVKSQAMPVIAVQQPVQPVRALTAQSATQVNPAATGSQTVSNPASPLDTFPKENIEEKNNTLDISN